MIIVLAISVPATTSPLKRSCAQCLRIVFGSLIAILFVNHFILLGMVPSCRIASGSMEPTLVAGQRIFVNQTAFWFRRPQRWEIVVFRSPTDGQKILVKRVAGLPGETIEIRGGKVVADGKALQSPVATADYSVGPESPYEASHAYKLADDEYFLLGDNPEISEDSRSWNPPGIPLELIVGSPLFVAP
jgi:signal peptidase I